MMLRWDMCVNRSKNSSTPEGSPAPEARQVSLAILGGSSAFTPALAAVLADIARDLPGLEVRLHGRNEERLTWVTQFCNRYCRSRSIPHEYTWSTSIKEAAQGVSIVINQMRIGGWAGRSHDELFPVRFGIPGDETIGPGGLASALRSVPVVLDAARQAAEAAPGAWFVNMGNPMGIVLAGLQKITGLKSFGLCELPSHTLQKACALLGHTPDDVEADFLGLNHQGWFVHLAKDGQDLLPELFSRIVTEEDRAFFKVEPEVMQSVHALPLPYMRIYYHTEREVNKIKARTQSRGLELNDLSSELYAWYRDDRTGEMPETIQRRDLSWFDLALAPAIKALLGGGEEVLYLSRQNGKDIPGLPASAIVEKRVRLSENGSKWIPFFGPAPEQDGPLEPFLDLLRRIVQFEEAALEAAHNPDEERVIAALRLHPLGIDADAARKMATFVLAPPGSLELSVTEE